MDRVAQPLIEYWVWLELCFPIFALFVVLCCVDDPLGTVGSDCLSGVGVGFCAVRGGARGGFGADSGWVKCVIVCAWCCFGRGGWGLSC